MANLSKPVGSTRATAHANVEVLGGGLKCLGRVRSARRARIRARARFAQNPQQKGIAMTLKLGDTAPDFEANTTEGPISFHHWIGDSWAVLFSHPKDFTPVCTTELGYMASIKPEFDRRGVKIIAISVDPLDKHEKWSDDIEETQGARPNYPMNAD